MNTTTFGVNSRAMCVECSDQQVIVRGLWWTASRIPTERIVALTASPSIIYCARNGRIRRKRIWFLARNRYADPKQALRNRMLDHVTQLVRSAPSRDGRRLKHLALTEIEEQRRIADAGIRWAARHPAAGRRELGEYWTKQQRRLEAEIARRGEAQRRGGARTDPDR